ncbi:MAG: SIR2 family protein [Thermoanaerobaculia bacterium]
MNTTTRTFKKDEVLVLLGAGASVDAGIPHSAAMVREIETALDNEWRQFKDLYNYVRSAIFYADGIRGTYANDVSYNIERLVASLDELSRREEHPLYPFIGAWNPRLAQVAGTDFRNVSEFKIKIIEKLRHEWLEMSNYEKADYFGGLIKFQRELNYPLRVFTLNYDLCVEKAYQAEYKDLPERGFDKDRFWSHELLEEARPAEKSLFLYKLHGSIDWLRDPSSAKLTFSDSTSKIRADEGELIFGTTYKLQYVDPFLFLVYQLRRLSLEAKLLLVVGYGFADEHINGILQQALRGGQDKRLVAVTWPGESLKDGERDKYKSRFRSFVAKQLRLENEQDERLVVHVNTARIFLGEELSLVSMANHFPEEESLFEEVRSE